MPGLIGFTDKRHRYDCEMLLKMRSLLKHFENYVDEALYSDENVYASRTHLGIIKYEKQPYHIHDDIFTWIEGEFYNQTELKSTYHIVSETGTQLLTHIYYSTKSFDFLRDLDGYYAASLYDKQAQQIHLITDRYGFKPLYWGMLNNDLLWSSELKGFLGHNQFSPIIDRQGVEEFFQVGYLLENRSWFEGIELVPPASVLSFDIQTSAVKIHQYWSWNEISTQQESVDERIIVEELGRLFKDAVHKRIRKHDKIGVTLSGGLDSRALVAAIPEDYAPVHTFTFGQKGCDDITFARKVSKLKGAKQHISIVDSNNWLQPRVASVWKAEAASDLSHMHIIGLYDDMKSCINVNLDGLAGDLVLGGSYLRESHLDKKIDPSIVKKRTHSDIEIRHFNSWYDINKTDPYFINNRVRRCTMCGPILLEKFIAVRIAFWDNELVEFVYSIPDRLRYESYIYQKMLLHAFPRYYQTIPWQKTGCPISYPPQPVALVQRKNHIVRAFKHNAQKFGVNFQDLHHHTDYPLWIRQEPAKTFFETMLLSKQALYPEYMDKKTVHTFLRHHMHGKSTHRHELCTALTFELWLQQVFESKYRS